MLQKGYLLIADLSGYTAYLSQTELEHAQQILEGLLNVLVEQMRPPLIISRLEGDAIFAYAHDGSFLQGQTLLEAIELIYAEFRQAQEIMRQNTTCTCRACSLLPTLDLKFAVHYGTYGMQRVGQHVELVGNDVNTAFRLTKNQIAEKMGIRGYAFFSEAVAAVALGELAEGMQPHVESYEHVGEVQGYVHNPHTVWARERERRRVRVKPEEADLVIIFDLPVPPSQAWDVMNDLEVQRRFHGATGFSITKGAGGRVGVGSLQHCAHGKEVNTITIVDWRPFHYMTSETRWPLPFYTTQLTTMELQPLTEGTRVVLSFAFPKASNAFFSWLARLAWRFAVKRGIRHDVDPAIAHERLAASGLSKSGGSANLLNGMAQAANCPV